MSPEALDLMQREKLTKMVMKDYFLENNEKDSILKMEKADIAHEAKVLEDSIFSEILNDLLKDELFFGTSRNR